MNRILPAVASKPLRRTWSFHACQIAVVLFLAAVTSHLRAEDDATVLHNAPKDLVVNGDSSTNDTMPSMAILSDGSTWIAWHAYQDRRDRVLARRLGPGGLGGVQQISGPGSIHDAPVLVAAEDGTAWVFWETLREVRQPQRSGGASAAGKDSPHGGSSNGPSEAEGRWQLMGRQLKQGRWQAAVVLSDEQTDAMMPAARSLGDGRLLLAWAACKRGRFRICYRVLDGQSWSEPAAISSPDHDSFRPAAAACEDGRAWVFWDSYRDGNYVIRGCRVLPVPKKGEDPVSPNGPKRAARESDLSPFSVSPHGAYAITPTALCTRQGLCVAWLQLEDVIGGAGVISQKHTLRMAVCRGAGWQLAQDEAGSSAAAALTHGIMVKIEPKPQAKRGYMGRCRVPMLIEDGDAVWLLWDRKRNPSGHPQLSDGELVGRPWHKGQWNTPVVLHQGLVDYHVAANPSAEHGKFFILASELPRYRRRIYHRVVADFSEHQPFAQEKWEGWRPLKLPLPREHESRHEIRLGEKTYKLFWADLHNHSTCTCDAEGELDELLRHARDRSQIDAVAITDNDDIFDDPLTEAEYAKTVFHARQMSRPGKFVAFPGYEWTACVFRPSAGIDRSDPRIYDYLTRRKLGHGTDHRTVIYTLAGGPLLRHSECNNDIRALHKAVEAAGGLALPQHSHWMPTGHPTEAAVEATAAWGIYIERAKERYHRMLGEYRYGLMGNSDCHRRHPGLAGALSGVYAEELTDTAILDAIRQRRVFATNGSRIVVDSRANGHFMGEELLSEDGTVEIVLDVIGTKPLVEVALIRDGEKLRTFSGNGKEKLHVAFKDEHLPPGTHWYYWRIAQEGQSPAYAGNAKVARGHLAWSSPHWVTVAGGKGLVGHWEFDRGQGDIVVDSSGNENDGEVWGADWVRGKFGTALRFDGQGAYVSIPQIAAVDGSDELTVEAWVYWEGSGRYPNIISGGTWSPGGFLVFVSDNSCSFRMGRPGFSATGSQKKQWSEVGAPLLAPFSLSRWYHLAATFKRPQIKTYLDGREVGSAKWDYPVGYKNDLIIGKWAGAVSHKGLIDEVKIFTRALSAEEIAASYQKEAAARTATPQGKKPYEPIPRKSQLAAAVATFDNEFAKLSVGKRGRCTALVDKRTGQDHVLRTSPLVSITQGDRTYRRAVCSLEDGKLVFRFTRAKTSLVLGVEAKPRYFVFRVESLAGPAVDELTFLHLNLKSCEHVNSMSGLAADDQFAVCGRTLNLRTRVQVGRNPPVLTATASKAHGLEGAKAALVACPTPQLMPVLQEVVRNEGLPYSALGGPFAQDAEGNRGSYVFARVSQKNVQQWIDLARRGGISTIHLSGWQRSLGHYEPSEALFPGGLDGLKAVAGKLHEAGLKVGIHTLTGCISTNDPWVRPLPDPRLATDGTYTLTADLGEKDTEVPTAEPPGNWPTVWAYGSRGNCIRIDDELIQYSALSNDPQCGFFKCRRGAFGTKVAPHKKGAAVGHMFVRYGCFVPDEKSTLVDEVAERIAAVYNTCGLDQIYMDGAEAMRGWYGIARMRQAIFTRLKRPALVEASCWDHHSWPFHSRVGAWDHPKWGLKRFADDHFRAVEQYRRAFLLEAQLGWWVILGPGRDWDMEMPDEIEYLTAKALGYDAPLSFQNVNAAAKPANARQDEFFTLIGTYERLRLANYFNEAVKEKLRQEREEFRLAQGEDGQWQFIPTDYLQHKVTGLGNGTSRWSVANRFAAQPVRLRIHALYSAYPYDDQKSMVLARCAKDGEFGSGDAARGVEWKLSRRPVDRSGPGRPAESGKQASASAEKTAAGARAPGGQPAPRPPGVPQEADEALCFAATNAGDSPLGAWVRAIKQFEPVVDMTPYDAIGLWVYGDGKGEIVNLQLTNLPEYFRTLDDHYVKVDFQGWRYFELLLRERDAAAYHDYKWPYGAHCVLHRSPLVRHAVNKLTLYLNNLPPKEEVACCLGPVKALRTRKVVLHNPAIEIGGKRLVFPVDLQSGMYIEFESPHDCRVYDERGNLLQWLKPQGEVPTMRPAGNKLAFTCEGTEGFQSRAEITVVTCGPPLRGRMPEDEIDWSLLRRQYEPSRTICDLDGRQNQWYVSCRPEAKYADVQFELKVDEIGSKTAAYDAPSAVTLENFEEPASTGKAPADQGRPYGYDSQHVAAGCKDGVRQQLARSGKIVKLGSSSARYTAASTRSDNGGWSVKGKQFKTPLDLSGFAALGFWLHGDAGGQSFKLQLCDAAGGWQDMYVRVDFSGWRYCQFPLGGPKLKDPSKIQTMNIYYNGIPAGKTVTCHVDEIRALGRPEPLGNPTLTVAGKPVRLPVAVGEGDRLVFRGMEDCRVYRQSGSVERVRPEGSAPRLSPGKNPVVFSLPSPKAGKFRVVVSLESVYR